MASGSRTLIDHRKPADDPAERPASKPTSRENAPLILATFACFAVLFGLSLWARREFLWTVLHWTLGIELSERGMTGLVVGLTAVLAAVAVYFVNHHPDR